MVEIIAQDEVDEGSNFSVEVNISYVENFDSASYDVIYDASIIQVTGVRNGSINGTEVPVDDWGFIPSGVQGVVRIINNMPGTGGVNGSGSLSWIDFDVSGVACDASGIEFSASERVVYDRWAIEISATWIDDSVHVAAVPTPTISPTLSPTPSVSPTVSATISPTVSPTVSATLSPTVSPTPTPTQTVQVWIEAPANVSQGSSFDATVNISYVENFDSASYDIVYNASVIEVTGVSNGAINPEIPVDDWGFIPEGVQGVVRIINNVAGAPGVNGSGYLSIIHFDVVGLEGDTSYISFNVSECALYDRWAQGINTTWIDQSPDVYVGPPPTPTPTLSPTSTISPTLSPTPSVSPTISSTISPTLSPTPSVSPTI